MDPLRREFIRYVFSREGQEDVVRDGYYPITQVIAEEQMSTVGIR
jgi:phosphate transport system substrate-binding protein